MSRYPTHDHKERHKRLHTFLDELVADFLHFNPKKMLSTTPIMDLMEWSAAQCKKPSEKPEEYDKEIRP